ncbi:DUF4864 domain-containing protein [Halostella sp. JP-L12]|uniref:DUF4864 domain-containing protein n=1 Tax=Halostella TaxID=1843185 RepID=UPI000EF79EEE|nr:MULTISPECIES: DUF4864 domain-containing protein [Halostella]NHN47793.1 DUF4864 domain-containing protein [Halostella sp. JP-L12]
MGIRLDEALRESDPEDATDFVADVWARSGWETSVDGATVTATRASETRRLLVCHDANADEDAGESGDATAEVDAVVSTGDDERAAVLAEQYDAASVGATDLYHRFAYGMPVEERDRLAERYFVAAAVQPPESHDGAATRDGEDVANATVDSAGPVDDADGSTAPERAREIGSPDDAGLEKLGPEKRESDVFGTEGREPEKAGPADGQTSDPADGQTTAESDAATDGPDGDETLGGDTVRRRLTAVALLLGLFAVGGAVALGVVPGQQAAAGESTTTVGGGGPAVGPGTAIEPETEAGSGVLVREVLSSVAVAPDRDAERRYVGLHPTCNRPPGLVVKIQLGALRQNDETLNKGIRTVWRFASPETRRATGPYPQFVRLLNSSRYRPMFEYTRAAYEPLVFENRTARQIVTLTTPNGSTATYEFRLSKQSGGEYDGCWMTDGVLRTDERAAASRE